jgi:cytidine deaminase
MRITSDQRDELIQQAQQARANAYAPYSGYAVGAAVLAASGRMYPGVNVENAAYPSGICAERAAVFNAVGAGERQIVAVAVATENGGTPCGSCRQVLSEFGPQADVILLDAVGRISAETTVADLLPRAFGPGNLPKKEPGR